MAAGGGILVHLFPKELFGWNLLNLTWFNASLVLAILPHEFAHAFVSRALGLRVFRIVLGSGRTWWRGSVFGFDVEAKTVPFGGVVVAAHRNPHGVRWKHFLLVLAGPLANAALFALAIVALGPRPWWTGFAAKEMAWWQVCAAANLIILVENLWPRRIQTALGQIPSDGRQLIECLFGWGAKSPQQRHAIWLLLESRACLEQHRLEEARVWVDRGLAEYPKNFQLREQLAYLRLTAGELEPARRLTLDLLAETDAKDAKRLVLLNNIAYVDALLDDPALLDEADHYSVEVLAAVPWSPSFKNTRGIVLLALNRLEEALPLLRESAKGVGKNQIHLAECLSVLAIAEARLGEFTAAEQNLAAARKASPTCFLLPRAEAAMCTAREFAAVQSTPPSAS